MMSRVTPFRPALLATSAALAREEGAVIALAQRILRSIGPRLRAEATRIDGMAGLALADALSDMVKDGERLPESWPVLEMVVLLEGDPDPRPRKDPLLHELIALDRRIDALAERRAGLMRQSAAIYAAGTQPGASAATEKPAA